MSMNFKSPNIKRKLSKVEMEEIEKSEFTAGVLSAFDEKISAKSVEYKYLEEFLLEQGISVCRYPKNYASNKYVKKVERIYEEIRWEMLAKKESYIGKEAFIKGFLLGTLIRSKQVHKDFCALQNNLSEIENTEAAKKQIGSNFEYMSDIKYQPEGLSVEIATAYLDGQLAELKKNSFTSEEESEIYRDIECVNELMSEVEELRSGTHRMYQK